MVKSRSTDMTDDRCEGTHPHHPCLIDSVPYFSYFTYAFLVSYYKYGNFCGTYTPGNYFVNSSYLSQQLYNDLLICNLWQYINIFWSSKTKCPNLLTWSICSPLARFYLAALKMQNKTGQQKCSKISAEIPLHKTLLWAGWTMVVLNGHSMSDALWKDKF